MALNDFIKNWDETSKVAQIVKGLTESREDPEAFSEHYRDLRKTDIGSKTELFTDYDPESPDAGNAQESILAHASILGRTNLEASYRYSNNRLEDILDKLKAKIGDGKLVGIVASVEPKADDSFSDTVKAYRASAKPISGEKPDFDAMRKKLGEKIDGLFSGTDKERIFAELAKQMYAGNDNLALGLYLEYFVKPQEAELKKAIASENSPWKTFITEGIKSLKKEGKIRFYTQLYELAKSAA